MKQGQRQANVERSRKPVKSRASRWFSLSEKMFWVCYLLLLVIHCVENTSVIYSQARWLDGMYLFRNGLYLVLIGKLALFSLYERGELVCALFFGAAALAGALASGEMGLLEFFVIMLAAKDVSPRRLVRVFAAVKAAGLALTVFLWSRGLLDAMYYQDDQVGYYNTYGFCHRNVLAANVVALCLAWFYLRYRRMKFWDAVLWCGAAAVMYRFALSRTGLIVLLLTVASMLLFRWKQRALFALPKFQKYVMGAFLGLLAVSVLGTVFYPGDSGFWQFVDGIFTKRFRFAHQCLEEYGLSLFGQRLPFVSSMEAQSTDAARLILDNSYMRALLSYGVIPGGVFLGLYAAALGKSVKKRSGRLTVCLLVFAVFGLSERYMLDVYYQFPLLAAWSGCFFKRNSPAQKRRSFPGHLQTLAKALACRTRERRSL